jgi:hypothetical protein
MAGTLWKVEDRESLLARFGQLQPATRPAWGTLDAPRMVTHVTDALRASLGEVPLTPMNGPLAVWPVNALVMFYLPWPKSAPTAPELLARAPISLSVELDTLRQSVGRFVAREQQTEWPPHAAFGRLSGPQWGRLMYRHFDHHLRQFGV